MDNYTYVASLGVSQENQSRCLAAMEKYGDNHWWEPDVDPRKFAYYQINEPIMLGTMDHFHESIELLLGRPVYSHEFGICTEELKQEAERAWKYQVGCTSDRERKDRVQASIDTLERWAKEHNKTFIKLEAD